MSRFRRLTISDHGMAGCLARVSEETLAAASPTISSSLTRARLKTRSVSRSDRFRPTTSCMASRACSSMWSRRIRSRSGGILIFGLGQDVVAEVSTQKLGCVQVDLESEDLGEFLLHGEGGESWHVCILELNEHVHVAVGTEISS